MPRQDSLNQEEDDEVFEDARETWDLETTPKELQATLRTPQISYSPHLYTSPRATVPTHPIPEVQPAPVKKLEVQGSPAGAGLDHIPRYPGQTTHATTPTSTSFAFSGGQQTSPPNSTAIHVPPTSRADTETRYQKECDDCGVHARDVWHCNVCRYSFCDACWERQFVHGPSRGRRHGKMPHEKTDPTIAEKVQKVLCPPADDWSREQLYRADEITSWFGIERPDDSGPPIFQDYGRFAELMASTDPVKNNPRAAFLENAALLGRDGRTPSLVSFVGQTGAGKSTLVKLMIDFALQDAQVYSTPVVGPPDAHLPTSEDVHLYMDPRTADSRGPVLYADCEGLEGGEREPLGAKFRKKRRRDVDAAGKDLNLKSNKVISERELKWADGPRERSREFAVTNLYPRLLYTFSDVIVFVLRNPRVVEHVFERLIKWAAAAIETSSNQPVLPHAIIVLNASPHDTDEKFWDVPTNTESVLDSLAHTVNRNETFKKWAQFWRERGKAINTLDELVLCYYSSVQILRIPQEGRPKLMQAQVEKLYNATLTACIAARCARNRLRMLLDVDDLQAYLQDAFSHYTSTLDSPFDFVQASFRYSPIPPDFGGNILKLALNVMDILQARTDSIIDARRIFSELSYIVASCIMLDNARHKSKGIASQIFPKYMSHLDDALENFCDHHWPCEFVNLKNQRCVNVRAGHQSKGHQSKDGKVIAAGDYMSSFSFNNNFKEFRDMVYSCLVALLEELTSHVENGFTEEYAAATIHRDMVLTNFFLHTTTGGDNGTVDEGFLHSHTACFCCLFGQAEHALPCGHVLCTPCVTMYGQWKGPNDIEIDGCPIEWNCHYNSSLWTIRLKPKSAGIRIMTLDGGGIRGIVELEVLKHIETALGGIPIQCFFDLIVGTSTGGLVALGLTTMNWTVDECIENFEKLCNQAFTRRSGGNLPIIGAILENYHHSKYQTSTLEDALKTVFPEDIYLFGGHRPADISGSSMKVAVTTTSLAGNKTYLLSNYNRPQSGHNKNGYHFQRPERIDTELKIWEAARATSAAPRFFKSFHHEMSQKTYIDGAIHHNNPVRVADAERRVLWPDIETPDIFLSIGTGSSIGLERQTSDRMAAPKKGVVSHGMTLLNILKKNMEATLDCERVWHDYFASVATTIQSGIATSRFLRINPVLEGDVPALDEKDKMGQVRRSARAALLREPNVKRVAQQLIASAFYFQLLSPIIPEDNDLHLIQGKIICRLRQPSREVHLLGKHLHKIILESGPLSFAIWEEPNVSGPLRRLECSQSVIETMIRQHKFEMGRFSFCIKSKVIPTHMYFCFGRRTMFPISGFPRSLFSDESSDNGMRTTKTTLAPFRASLDSNHLACPSSRYTHGSRRLKKATAWEPPDLHGRPSLTNLRQYADPDRAIGSDIINRQMQMTAETDKDRQLPEVAPRVTPPVDLPQQKPGPEGQSSTATTLRNAFRALLWPIRAQTPGSENASREEELSRFVSVPELDIPELDDTQALASPYQRGEDSNTPPTIWYYHVNSADNEIYQQWADVLSLSMGRWVPLGRPEEYSRSANGVFEMHGDSTQPVELSTGGDDTDDLLNRPSPHSQS